MAELAVLLMVVVVVVDGVVLVFVFPNDIFFRSFPSFPALAIDVGSRERKLGGGRMVREEKRGSGFVYREQEGEEFGREIRL